MAAQTGAVMASTANLTPTSAAAVAPPVLGVDESSMGSFLLVGLTAMYKNSSRKHEQLRQQCVEVISKIKAEEKTRQEKALKGSVNTRAQHWRRPHARALAILNALSDFKSVLTSSRSDVTRLI
jgi:hypothetical protein